MRYFATFLAVRIRLALAEDRLDDAVHDLQTIFAMGRHLNQAPTLICGLAGVAVTNLALQQVDQLIQHGAAPNLYWALTDLPQPFIDLRTAFQGERIGVYGSFPGLPMTRSDPIQPLTEEQAEQTSRMMVGLFFDEPNRDLIPRPALKLRVALDMQKKHKKAKAALVESGWPRDTVEKLPHLHVGLLHGLLEYERQMDETMKWNSFPYWQAAPALLEMEKRYVRPKLPPGPDEPALPIAAVFLPGSSRILFMRTRTDRKIAALYVVSRPSSSTQQGTAANCRRVSTTSNRCRFPSIRIPARRSSTRRTGTRLRCTPRRCLGGEQRRIRRMPCITRSS